MTPAELEALRWAIRRAEEAEDRAVTTGLTPDLRRLAPNLRRTA